MTTKDKTVEIVDTETVTSLKKGVRMNNEFLLKVVNYVADHFGNLPDNSKPGFENFTNDEFDTAVKYLAEIGVLKLNQSKDFSYCGRRDIETNDDYEEYYVTKAFISEENLKKFKASLEQ